MLEQVWVLALDHSGPTLLWFQNIFWTGLGPCTPFAQEMSIEHRMQRDEADGKLQIPCTCMRYWSAMVS